MIALALLLATSDARTYALIIGNNTPLTTDGLAPLRYADDDAAGMAELLAATGADVTLLTEMDAQTQARFALWAEHSAPPSLARFDAAVERIGKRLREDASAGRLTSLWLFFSGHGHLRKSEGAALAMRDGGLTQQKLYAALDALPADTVHLFVDACHAEAIVRPRNATSTSDVNESDLAAFANARSLARYGHVGAIVATAADQPAHEWDAYESGIFTRQLLSALRGAADVNSDRRIEYSEVHAFLVAANREIKEPRARLAVIARPPPMRQRAVLVDLDALSASGLAHAKNPSLARFWIEDLRGVRLVDAHLEAAHAVTLGLPRGEELFLRSETGEASFRVDNRMVELAELRLSPPSTRARGALATALARGLFAASFGPVYYRGFVDSTGELAVDFRPDAPLARPAWPVRKRAALGLWITSGAATAVSAGFAFAVLAEANLYNSTPSDTVADAARMRHGTDVAFALASAGVTLTSAIIGFALYPWSHF